jgi:glyoxylase-like metal-dependent hydrolase (beta-lactamase superfamily II)
VKTDDSRRLSDSLCPTPETNRERDVKIHVLGCHGSDILLHRDGAPHSCHTCSFLLDDTLLLDAGTVGNKLSLEAQAGIRHILLSHLHFDHSKGLPTLADNLSEEGGPPVVIAGIPEVIKGLHDPSLTMRSIPISSKFPQRIAPCWRLSG